MAAVQRQLEQRMTSRELGPPRDTGLVQEEPRVCLHEMSTEAPYRHRPGEGRWSASLFRCRQIL